MSKFFMVVRVYNCGRPTEVLLNNSDFETYSTTDSESIELFRIYGCAKQIVNKFNSTMSHGEYRRTNRYKTVPFVVVADLEHTYNGLISI